MKACSSSTSTTFKDVNDSLGHDGVTPSWFSWPPAD